MNKRLISVLTAIVLIVTMIYPTLGAGDDNWGDDNIPWNISISNATLLGDYELGTLKEFQLGYYPSGSVGLKVIRHLEITGDAEVSDFEYYENGQWNDVSNFTIEMTLAKTTMQRVHVTFHEAGIYTVRFWATSVSSGEELVVSKRVITVSSEGIALHVEPETTTESKTDESTSEQPTTKAEPVTTKKITETTAKEPATSEKVSVAKTKIKKATKKKSAKKVKISLKKVKKAYGYEIKLSTSSKFKKKKTITKITRKTSCTIKKLKPGKKYYVKARAFVKNGKNNIYGNWCKKKKVKFSK